ncbi:MAG: histidine--tRNA ligase [Patescibacteria group bacterium]|nr:histidine--tRNA ligase [Patescibacteria group bacterium]
MSISIPRAKKKVEKKPAGSGKKIPFQSPKGMHDRLPADFIYIDKIEKALKKVSGFYGFDRIETPVLEDIKLFERGTGLTSEVVQKQMFTVKTKGDGVLALRPEMTPGVVRAYVEHGLLHVVNPGKFFYMSPVFRYEQPQHGRFRQFYQIGFEVLNSDDPVYDAQIINASLKIFDEVRLKNVTVKLNTIGCKTCRAGYVKKLKEYYKNKLGLVCRDCVKRYAENPLRMLDCKQDKCQPFKAEAPQTLDFICNSCKTHFKSVLEFLDGAQVPYMIDPTLVRGLDYYARTVFEFFAEGVDFALGGGGRYDYLSETMGGPKMPAIGLACGVERMIEAMKLQNIELTTKQNCKAFLIYMGDQAKKQAMMLLDEFYKAGVPVRESFAKESLKSQLRLADKEQVHFALILGQREVFEEVILLRDMKTGAQETIPLKKIVAELKKRI